MNIYFCNSNKEEYGLFILAKNKKAAKNAFAKLCLCGLQEVKVKKQGKIKLDKECSIWFNSTIINETEIR